MNKTQKLDVKLKNRILLSALAESLDSDSDNDLIATVCNHYNKKKSRRVAIKLYIENVTHLYKSNDFKNHFRLRQETFEYLLQILGPSLVGKNKNGIGRHTYSPETQLLVALSMLANQEVYRIIAEKFDICKSTAWLYVKKVCCLLVKLSKDFISWPSGRRAQEVMEKFKTRQGFPGVLGAINGTHIPITPPLADQGAYCNRHHYHSVILQAVCDADYKFTDVFAGYPGSVHDARVFTNSPLGKKINETPFELFPANNSHILGDSAYKCTNYVLTPYRDDRHLTRKQKNFNFKHSSTRVYIEQCFGLLKGRFRILKHINVYNTQLIPSIIIACCVLHNICMSQNDILEIPQIDVDKSLEESCNEKCSTGAAKRNNIADSLFSGIV